MDLSGGPYRRRRSYAECKSGRPANHERNDQNSHYSRTRRRALAELPNSMPHFASENNSQQQLIIPSCLGHRFFYHKALVNQDKIAPQLAGSNMIERHAVPGI
ncbi:hypothetical protein [uncultured Bradyrhizobium sp.]|uniref:hypothetical protein n=1 Tax=uncultured Bradyrhizobium sp. TaxID=199684 RepID=UPI0035CC91E3